jgi:hypothetical protein
VSRHRIPHRDQTWTVGYDPVMATYYAQVEPARPADELTDDERAAFLRTHHPRPGSYADDELLLTVIGDRHGQVRSLEELRVLLADRGVTLTPEVDGALELERRGTYTEADRHPRTRGQLLAEARAALGLARRAYPPPLPRPDSAPDAGPGPGTGRGSAASGDTAATPGEPAPPSRGEGPPTGGGRGAGPRR